MLPLLCRCSGSLALFHAMSDIVLYKFISVIINKFVGRVTLLIPFHISRMRYMCRLFVGRQPRQKFGRKFSLLALIIIRDKLCSALKVTGLFVWNRIYRLLAEQSSLHQQTSNDKAMEIVF